MKKIIPLVGVLILFYFFNVFSKNHSPHFSSEITISSKYKSYFGIANYELYNLLTEFLFEKEEKEKEIPSKKEIDSKQSHPIEKLKSRHQYLVADCVEEEKMDQQIEILKQKISYSEDITNEFEQFNSVMMAPECPKIQIVDLRGTPNFPQTNLLNVCGSPDTLSLLVFTDDPGEIRGFELTLNLVPGMRYAGFEDTHYGGATTITPISTSPYKPKFVLEGITSGDIFVANIGVASDCLADIVNNNYTIDIDYKYIYFDTSGQVIRCDGTDAIEDDFNSAIKTPVLNIRDPSPAETTITMIGSPACQTIKISQDGLQAYLDSIEFNICRFEVGGDVTISSMMANGMPLSYTINAADSTVTAMIGGSFFSGNAKANPSDNQFNTDEELNIVVCYQTDQCPNKTTYPLIYKATYSCYDEVCQVSSKNTNVLIKPTGALNPTATSQMTRGLAICGDNGLVDITLNNPNTDTDQNAYTNLKFGFQTCDKPNVDVVGVTINGIPLPSDAYEWVGDDINIDLSTNTNGALGLVDHDDDGFYDDLRGGQSITAQVELGITCGAGEPDSATENCPTIACPNVQFYVEAEKNCGATFKTFPSTTNFNIHYGQTSVTNENTVDLNSTGSIVGYSFGTYSDSTSTVSTGPKQIEATFCYDFGSENVADCSVEEVNILRVTFNGQPFQMQDLTFVPGSAMLSTDGGTTYSAAPDGTMTYPLESKAILEIPAGSNATSVCYKYSMQLDSCICAPNQYFVGTQQVISTCNDCGGPDGCQMVKACKNVTFSADASCSPCECWVEQTHVLAERANYGFADKTMTTQLTAADVPAEDRTRFLPGDTLDFQQSYVIRDERALLNMNRWYFSWHYVKLGDYGGMGELELSMDATSVELTNFSISDPGGPRTDIDLSSLEGCLTDDVTQYGGVWSSFHKQPWGDAIDSIGTGGNSSVDTYDNNQITFYLWNYGKIEESGCTNAHHTGGDCLDEMIDAYSIEVGDTLHLRIKVPLIKNPYREALKKSGVPVPAATNVAQIISSFNMYEHNDISGDAGYCSSYVGSACRTNPPFFVDCPGEVKATTNLTLDNCGGLAQHSFYLDNLPPLDWFSAEFRPLLNLQDVDLPIYTPLSYCDNAFATKNGVNYPLQVSTTENMICKPVIGPFTDDLCRVDSLSSGTITFNLEDANLPPLGVGLGNCDTTKINYALCLLCPAEINGISEYELNYDYAYLDQGPRLTPYNCNFSEIYAQYSFCDEIGLASNANYYDYFNLDTIYRRKDQKNQVVFVTDNRIPTLPVVTTNLGPNLIASDVVNISEEIHPVEICNPDPMDAMGVDAYVSVPSSVRFVGAYSDAAGTTPFTSTLVSDDGMNQTFSITLTDETLSQNECVTIYIGTTLLYCPEPGSSSPTICVGGSSGCSPKEVRAALGGSKGCGSSEICYAYIFGEADLQSEWFGSPTPAKPALCDTMTFYIRVKNVKDLTLLNLETGIKIPDGLTVIPSSWQVAYPGGSVDFSGNFGDWTPIPEPDSVNGNIHIYSDDALWNDYIHLNGLPGIRTTSDSNKVSFQFRAITNCDEFLSGAVLTTETKASDPCSPGLLSSGSISSPRVIIDGADPNDNAQILTFSNPDVLYCGGLTNEFGLSALNISDTATTDSVLACLTFPKEIAYQTGSLVFTIPADFTPNYVEESIVGDDLVLCFNAPKLLPGETFSVKFMGEMQEDAECGLIGIGADIKSFVDDVVCQNGPEPSCGVYVQNSINPNIFVELKAPLETADIQVNRDCSNGDDPASVCYKITLVNPGPDYNGNVRVGIHDDVTANSVLDIFDTELNGMDHAVSILSGDTLVINACLDIASIQSCPIIIKQTYETDCTCDTEVTPIKNLPPSFIDTLGETVVMCPGEPLALDICGDYEYTLEPAEGATLTFTDNDDSLIISLNDGFGIAEPVVLKLNGMDGECPTTAQVKLKSIGDFIPQDQSADICDNDCVDLDLKIPTTIEGDAKITWTPSTGLSDPTSATPTVCFLTADQVYNVEIAFGSDCVYNIEYTVTYHPNNGVSIGGESQTCEYPKPITLTSDAGYDKYDWYQILEGFEIIVGSSTTENFTAVLAPGDYIVKAYRSDLICPAISGQWTITTKECVDLELEKSICEIDEIPNINDTISYQIIVCNRFEPDSGLVYTANTVQITDSLPASVLYVDHSTSQGTYTPGGGGLWDLGSIAAGECDTLKIDVQIIDYGTISNTAEITRSDKDDIDSEEDNDDGDQSEDDEDNAEFEIKPFDLALIKEVCYIESAPLMSIGDSIIYCIIVENQGEVDAYNIIITDDAPAELALNDPDWIDHGTYWEYQQIDSLLVGEKDTIEVVTTLMSITPSTGPYILNYAEILDAEDKEGDHPEDEDSTPDGDYDNETNVMDNISDNTGGDEDDHDPAMVHIGVVDVALKKTTPRTTPVKVGETILYYITVYNQGNVPLTNIKVTEYIPDGLALNTGSSTDWMDMDSVAMYLIQDTLLAIDSVVIPISMDVQPGATPANLVNVAEVTSVQDTFGFDVTGQDMDSYGDDDPDNDNVPNPNDPDDDNIDGDGKMGGDEDDSDPAGLTVFDLALNKTTAQTGPFAYGDEITFDLTVYNQGNVAAANIEITEYIPCGYVLDTLTNPDWMTGMGNTASTVITETIQPGMSHIVPIKLILQYCEEDDAWKNAAEISSSEDDMGNDTSDEDIDSDPDNDPDNDGEMEDNDIDGTNGDEDDSDFELVEIFDLAQIKQLVTPGPYMYGDTLTYAITVYNQGNVPATNIVVMDTIPEGLTFDHGLNMMIWSNTSPNIYTTITDTLYSMDSTIVYVDLILTMTDGSVDSYTNYSEISSAVDTMNMTRTDSDSTPDTDTDNDAGGEPNGPNDDRKDGDGTDDEDDHDPAILDVFDLALKKTTLATGPFRYGDPITYDITVYNQGNVPSTNIEVTEYIPCGYMFGTNPDWTLGADNKATTTISNTIQPGDSSSISINLIIQDCNAIDAWKNVAEISYSEDDMGNDTSDDDFDSMTDNDPDNDGDMEDNVTDGTNDDEDDSDFEVIEIFDLAQVKKLVTPGPHKYGDTLTYMITVFNQGNVPATDIQIIDSLPDGLAYDPTINSDLWSGSHPIITTTLVDTIPTVGIIIDTLYQMDTGRVYLNLIVQPSNEGAVAYTNYSEISGANDSEGNPGMDVDSNPDMVLGNDAGGEPNGPTDNQLDGNGTDDEDDHDPAILDVFDLALKKTTNTAGPYAYGDVIVYDLTVYNQGNIGATNIEISDYLPCGYKYLSSNDSNWSYDDGTRIATTTIPDLAPADSTVVSIEVEIQACGGVDGWKNVAEISNTLDEDGNPVDDIDSTPDNDPDNDGEMKDDEIHNDEEDEDDSDLHNIEVFDLALNKKLVPDQKSPVRLGDIIRYHITVFNQGNLDAYDIQVGDYLPAGLSYYPELNTAAATGNQNDWQLVDGLPTYVVDSLKVGDSTTMLIALRLNNDFVGNEIINYAEITHAARDKDGPNERDIDSETDTNSSNDTGGTVESNEDDHIDDNGKDSNGDGITDEDDHDPAIIEISMFYARINSPCICQANGMLLDNIIIYTNNPKETWTLVKNNGAYSTGSNLDNLSAIALGTKLTFVEKEGIFYKYSLPLQHVSGIGYLVEFENDNTNDVKKLAVANQCECNSVIDPDPDGTPGPPIPTKEFNKSKTPAECTLETCDGTDLHSSLDEHKQYVDTAACRIVETFCPENQWQTLMFTVSQFDLAIGDTLCIFEGRDTFGMPIAEWTGTGVSQTGGWISSGCDPEVNVSGCLTFLFKTNGDNQKGLGFRGNFTCNEKEIALNATPLFARLECEETFTMFDIKPARIMSNCNTIVDTQRIKIYDGDGNICIDTCLGGTESMLKPFGIGQYVVEYILKSDTVKTTATTIAVQQPSLVCNDEVTIPLGAACGISLTPDDLLENPCDTITDTMYYYITIKGLDSSGKEKILATGGGKGSAYPSVTKDMIADCSGTVTATIERRYYEGLSLPYCNGKELRESCEVKVNVIDNSEPWFVIENTIDTLVRCDVQLTQEGLGLATPDAIDNCGEATVIFESARFLRDGSVCDTSLVEVTWTANDECGNTKSMNQLIVFVRPRLEDIVKPENIVLSCGEDDASEVDNLTKTGIVGIKIGKIKNGQLEPSDTIDLSFDDYVCGYILQKNDVQLEADCGIKVYRYWEVLDWCDPETGITTIDTQFISWKDTLAPVFDLDSLPVTTLSLPHHTCEMDITKLEKPHATDNCSEVAVRIDKVFRIEDGELWDLETDDLTKLPCDSFQVQWVAADACHEQLKNDTLQQIVLIEDQTKPAAVCTDTIHLSLSGDYSKIHFKDIDAGSNDNCGISKYELSRDEENWDEYVTINCEDVHQYVKVYLRVTDFKGNQNTCWMVVLAEDKVAPICSDLPDVTADCDTEHRGALGATTDSDGNGKLDDEWKEMSTEQIDMYNKVYGYPNCSDNLSCQESTIEQQYQLVDKGCGVVHVIRRYRATDWFGYGNVANWAEQNIYLEYKADWVITLPADWKGDCGAEIPATTATIENGTCDLMGMEVEESTFTSVEDACIKVVRTYTFINWCEYKVGEEPITIARIENAHHFAGAERIITAKDFEYAKAGKIQYTQVLKLQDTQAPILTIAPVDNCITGDDCAAIKSFAVSAKDCNDYAEDQLTYRWSISANNIVLSEGTTATFEYEVHPKIDYVVKWTVADNCGNSAWEEQTYEFWDCKKPSPYCLNGITVGLMEGAGMIQVWASDIERGSSDNCTAKDELELRIWHQSIGSQPTTIEEVEALPKLITFSCNHIDTQEVGLYVIDEEGNWDYCRTTVIVQDNNNTCSTIEPGEMAMVRGKITDWFDRAAEEVKVEVMTSDFMMTSMTGTYEFELPLNRDYEIVPQKDVNPLNGVSTFDLVLISKHILGIQSFDNPYQWIAADVNKSKTVTAFDMVQLRRMILNIEKRFANNTSWRFVQKDHQFDAQNPLTSDFPEMLKIEHLATDQVKDFIAVKIGDINGNAQPSSQAIAEGRNNLDVFDLHVADQELVAGKAYSIPFTTNKISSIQGYQFSLDFHQLGFKRLAQGVMGLGNFGLHRLEEGLLTASWNKEKEALPADDQLITTDDTPIEPTVLFTIEVVATQNGRLSDLLQITSAPTMAEAYDNNGKLMKVKLTYDEIETKMPFDLFQNQPNPFNNVTAIGFYLPSNDKVIITLTDEVGKVVKVFKEDRKAGYNSIEINSNQLPSGVIYYQLTTKFGTKTKKMLHLN